MRRRFRRNLAFLLIAGASLGGCVQATRHSNTMVFGTNTAFGIVAGQDATGIPSVTVGYRRQEAVVMPLVANTQDNGSYQMPCDIEMMGPVAQGQMNPCLLVALSGRGAIDTYSVLASFGADFSGSGTNPNASGTLAQFFSTGIAAQNLAMRGGAALVAASDSATVSASNELDPAVAAALSSPAVVTATTEATTALATTLDQIVVRYRAAPDPAAFVQRVAAFETAAGIAETSGFALMRRCNREALTGTDAARAQAEMAACLARARPTYQLVQQQRLQRGLERLNQLQP